MRSKMMSVQDVAEYLGVSEKHVRRLCWGHWIEHHRSGTRILISEKALDSYLESIRMEAIV